MAIPDTLEGCVNLIWNHLNEANKISLYVRYTDLATGTWEERIVQQISITERGEGEPMLNWN